MRRLLRVPVLLVMLASGARSLHAQELGLLAVGAASDNVELPTPRGFVAFGQLRRASWLFRLSLVRYDDATDKAGTVCQVYSPRIGCRAEGVSTTARMGGLRFTAMRAVRVGELLELGFGGGLSFNQLSAEARGESGSRADLHLPNTGQIGYLGTASVAVAPVPALPVKLVAGLSGHWVEFRGCVSAEDRTSGYAPFCGWDRFTEAQAGLSFTLPRRD